MDIKPRVRWQREEGRVGLEEERNCEEEEGGIEERKGKEEEEGLDFISFGKKESKKNR